MWKLFISFLVTVLGTSSVIAGDKCLPILTAAAHDNYEFTYTNDLLASAKNFFCDEQFLSYRKKDGQSFGLTVPIEGAPVRFGMDSTDEKSSESRRKFCQSSSSKFDERTSLRIVQSIVRRDALDAFVECQKVDAGNVPSLTLTTKNISEQAFSTQLIWKRIRPSEPIPRIKQVLLNGAKCRGTLRVGKTLPEGSGATAECSRIGKGAVSIIVSTEFDAVDAYLPPTSALGQCNVATITEVAQWSPTGECKMGAALTDQLHRQPERSYSIQVQVDDGKRLTGVCSPLSCAPRPGFDNGCAFGRQVNEVRHSERYIEVQLMVGSHPQIWQEGFGVEQRSVRQVEVQRPTALSVFAGKLFTVDSAPSEKVVLHCSIQRNIITFDPAGEVIPTPFKRKDVSTTPTRKIYQFEVNP